MMGGGGQGGGLAGCSAGSRTPHSTFPPCGSGDGGAVYPVAFGNHIKSVNLHSYIRIRWWAKFFYFTCKLGMTKVKNDFYWKITEESTFSYNLGGKKI